MAEHNTPCPTLQQCHEKMERMLVAIERLATQHEAVDTSNTRLWEAVTGVRKDLQDMIGAGKGVRIALSLMAGVLTIVISAAALFGHR